MKRTSATQFCVDHTGIDPKNADEFREFLVKCFVAAERVGFRGAKQLQAYSRPLDFTKPRDSDVLFAPTKNRERQLTFGNFVVFECAQLAAQRGWPHQIHVGTHNIPDSNPLELRTLFRSFPQVNFILLHCWPFLEESAYLAKSFANVYLDPCWTPILNPSFFRQALERWIGYLPDTKVTISHDATSVEMAAGCASFSRSILAQVLEARVRDSASTFDAALALARNYLAENARRLYQVT